MKHIDAIVVLKDLLHARLGSILPESSVIDQRNKKQGFRVRFMGSCTDGEVKNQSDLDSLLISLASHIERTDPRITVSLRGNFLPWQEVHTSVQEQCLNPEKFPSIDIDARVFHEDFKKVEQEQWILLPSRLGIRY